MAPKISMILSASFLAISILGQAVVSQICTPTQGPYVGPKMPKIPDQFSMDVSYQRVISDDNIKKMETFALQRIFFDLNRKLVAVETGHGMKRRREIIDNNRKQFMVIAGKDCTVQNFTSNPKDPFYEVKDYKSGNDFFYFGPDNATTYVGNYTIRGINCDIWKKCIKQKDNSTFTFVFYFTRNDSMNPGTFVGMAKMLDFPNNKSEVTKAVWALNVDERPPKPQHVQVPMDVFCPMKKTKMPLPKPPAEFEMNSEILMPGRKIGFNTRDYVDTKEKYFRSDHHEQDKNGVWVPVHEIHDFNTGINYSINARTFECKAKPLGNRTWDAKETDDHHHIRMRTATEFWGLDHPDYIYEGYRDVRGVPADIFARKSPSRRRPGSFVILKWYFSRPSWRIGGQEGPINSTRVPMKLTITNPNSTTTMNFFNYDPVEPTTHILWPLRSCYLNNRHYMYFRLSGQYDTYGVNHQRAVTSGIRDALAKAGRISELRVSSILIFKSAYGGVVAVRVYVLGVPAIKGSVLVLHPRHLVPMKIAVKGIKDAITSGKLDVKVKMMKNGKQTSVDMSAQKDSYYDLYVDGPDPLPNPGPDEHSKAGMKSGAVALLSIALILCAVILTIGAIYVVLKRRGVQLFNYQRHTDDSPVA